MPVVARSSRHFSVTKMTLQIEEDSIPEQAAMTSANQTNFKDPTLINGSAHKIKLKEEWIAVPTYLSPRYQPISNLQCNEREKRVATQRIPSTRGISADSLVGCGATPSDDGRLPDAAFDRRTRGRTAVYERAATGLKAAIVSPLKER